MTDNNMLTQTEVLLRGWTKSMIEKLLPEPKLAKNKHCSKYPTKLWSLEVVEQIEQTEEYKEYLENGVFAPALENMIYIERITEYGRLRRGLVMAIDLEENDWKPEEKAKIRATEATILERIPPRVEIRKKASIELPHIMLLVNDRDKKLVEKNLDFIVANDVTAEGAGFSVPTNIASIIYRGGKVENFSKMSKAELAEKIISHLAEIFVAERKFS